MAQGADVSYNYIGPSFLWEREWDSSDGKMPPPWAKVIGLARVPDADVVVMQRPALRWWSDLIPFLQAAGVKVVVDMDDMFAHIDEGNVAKAAYATTGREAEVHGNSFIDAACRQADLVICSTPALVKRYGYGHARVIPNYIPERYFLTFGYSPQTIGWSGSVGTHPKDLQVTGGAVQDALDTSGWSFRVVGTGAKVQSLLGLSEPPATSGWVPFGEYPLELARLSIGIVPLADTLFNRSKSALKLMEMTVCGAAVVASPTPDNQRLHEMGVGVLATTPQQWRKRLNSLVKNDEYRLDLAGRGREAMRSLTYELNCGRWWDAWASTLDNYTRRDAALDRLDRLETVAAGVTESVNPTRQRVQVERSA